MQRLSTALAAFALVMTAAPALAQTSGTDYAVGDNWLCRPGRADACAVDLSATSISAKGGLRREAFKAASKPKIDCFYVYPTVSLDAGVTSDLNAGPEERRVVAAQFARFGSVCRTFAPAYRQVTATTLRQTLDAGTSFPAYRQSLGYADVLRAWKRYLETDNQGRGVVLIGDGQGAEILTRLLAEEIDGKPDQALLVSAILTSATVRTVRGADVGGTFRTVPLCRAKGQVGCVITYSPYRALAAPGEDAWYGRNGEEGVAACTNPAELRKGEGAANAYFMTLVRGAALRADSPTWAGPDKPVGTPYVKVPGLVRTTCTSDPEGAWLAVRINADPADPRADDIGGDLALGRRIQIQAGLAPIAVELGLGDLVDAVERQARAYKPTRK